MNKAVKLFDELFVKELLVKEVLPLYPHFATIEKIAIHPYKDYIWEHTYHIVVEYRTTFKAKDGKTKILPIFCSAHSDEPRKNVFDSLKFLWQQGFGKGYLSIPHALFYSDEFQGTFYRGVEGMNLYQYIREGNKEEIESIIPKAAQWFAKLHNIESTEARNFNEENSRIKTVFPGVSHILSRVKRDYPQYGKIYSEIYERTVQTEEDFLKSTAKRWLVHGDAHPENIIKMSKRKIAVIDFTDLCLSDWTRDIGSFFQQLEFMIMRKMDDIEFFQKASGLFLKNYLDKAKVSVDSYAQERIDNYYNWTAIRTATFFLIKAEPEPKRAMPLIKKICSRLNIKYVN